MMTRREILAAGAASALLSLKPAAAQASGDKGLLGGSPTTFSVRAKAAKLNNQPFDVVEHCHELGTERR